VILAVVGTGLAVGAPFAVGGRAVLDSLGEVAPSLFLVLAGLSIISGTAKAGKLQLLLLSLGQARSFWRTLAIAFATDLAFLCSPAGAAGYAVNIGLLRNSAVPWSTATAVVGAEQALDLVFFAVAIPLAILSAGIPLAHPLPATSESTRIALLVIAALFVLALWRARLSAAQLIRDLAARVPWLRARQIRIAGFIAELRAQILALSGGSIRRNFALLLLTTLQWLSRYGVLWLALKELGHAVPFGFALALQGFVLHLALWTGIPAGGGSADLGLAAALAPWASRPVIATALLLWRFSTLYFPLILGILSLGALALRAQALNLSQGLED
jgi:uncharacterized protein (TIRG00374 family)